MSIVYAWRSRKFFVIFREIILFLKIPHFLQTKSDARETALEFVPETESLKSSAVKSIFSQVAVSASANPFAAGKEAVASYNPFSNKDTGASLNPFMKD